MSTRINQALRATSGDCRFGAMQTTPAWADTAQRKARTISGASQNKEWNKAGFY